MQKRVLTLPICICAYSIIVQTSFALDNPIASASLSTLQGVNSSNAANTQEALGVEAHAVGDQSSMSGDSMGAVGKRIATMSLVMKPQCDSDTVLNGLDGAELKFPCQPISSALTGTICLPKLADCKDSKNFAPLVVPLGSNNNIYGYNFTASCQANCMIKMSQSVAVINNADSITNQSKQAAAKNDQYNMVAQGYIGKDGYSKQQAFLWSFGKGGENDLIGNKCINGATGYLASGEYHTCDNSQSGSFKTGCHEEKTCTDWKITHRDIDTYHQCILKAKVSDVQCDKVPVVTVQEVVIPAKDVPFSGSGHTDYRSEPYHAGASFTFPYTGTLKSFSITANGNWFGHFWIQIQPVHGMIDTRLYQQSISYSFSGLAIPVTAGQKGSIYADGREYASVPDVTTQYSGVIKIPEQRHKEAHTTWQSSCPSV